MNARDATLLLALLAGCSSRAAEPSPPRHPAPAPNAAPTERTRIVLAVVIDQLPSWALARYLEHLPEDGALRTGVARGAYIERVDLGYATSVTAAGHAAVHTGAAPRDSGIYANTAYSPGRGEHPMVDDGAHPLHGSARAYAAPTVLRAEAVGDVLERETGDRAVTLSIAVKDRAAVLSGGKRPDLALWYDKGARRFTTSSYYAAMLPAWLEAWNERHPIESLFTEWRPLDPALYARVAGADDDPGEGDWHGLGSTFPHRLSGAGAYSALRATPQLTDHLLELVQRAAAEHRVGADDVVDLVAVSIAGTDYAGHIFGPTSWEYVDNLMRADRALSRLIAWLESQGPLAVLITSDHGATPKPELATGAAGRLFEDELAELLRGVAEQELGEGRWVEHVIRPFVYLSPELTGEPRRRAIARMIEALRQVTGIHSVAEVREAVGWLDDSDPLRQAIAKSLPPDTPADLYFATQPGFVVDESRASAYGSGHGGPWPADREVPVIFWGPGVEHVRVSGPLARPRVAATLGALLGVPPPRHARAAAPLPGAPEVAP